MAASGTGKSKELVSKHEGKTARLLDPEINGALERLRNEWDVAEGRIKKAELVRANNVVSSAIFELRYAGRKLVDAIALLQACNWQPSSDDKRAILEYIADAIEDCVKAKHDAIDAMLVFVTTWFARTEEAIGLADLVIYFPKYIEITGKVSNVQDRIAESRSNRSKRRESIYNAIDLNEYEEILSLYSTMLAAESRVSAQVAAENAARESEQRRSTETLAATRIGTYAGIIGAVVGVLGVIVAIVALAVGK